MPNLTTIGFDADDTLWQNEQFFRMTEDRFVALLGEHGEAAEISGRLLEAEKRNLGFYGFGIKGFVLSMIETAIEITRGQVPASVIGEILAAGREMAAHPVETLPHVNETLAALSGGLTEPGDINIICGTCEIINVCFDHPIGSPNFNVRCHAIPGRWLSFFVLNTGGKALEWFYKNFCRDMSEQAFYTEYIPSVLDAFFADPSREETLPGYVPFLGGSRYSLEPLKAEFSGVTLETTRDDFLLAIIRGNALYHKQHLDEVRGSIKLGKVVMTSGGSATIRGYLEAKKRWTGDFEYRYQDQCSELGAAMLAQMYQRGTWKQSGNAQAQPASRG